VKNSHLVLALILCACSLGGGTSPTPTDRPFEPTFTAQPEPLILLIKPDGADEEIAAMVAQVAALYAEGHGMRFEVRSGLDPEFVPNELEKLLVLAPDPGALALAAAAPNSAVITIGFAPDGELPNLTALEVGGGSQEVSAFVAGYAAALSADDWRAGMIYTSQSAHLVDDFISGVEYFCGSCIPVAPPNLNYPQAVQAPDPANWQAAADELLGQFIRVVYLAPEIEISAAASYLANYGVFLLGASEPPAELSTHWIASISLGSSAELREQLAAAIDGQVPESNGIILSNVNPALLSEGRQAHIQALISDLLAGLITPGDSQ
jgi:hypothetical protein